MDNTQQLSDEFLALCKSVTAKRPKVTKAEIAGWQVWETVTWFC